MYQAGWIGDRLKWSIVYMLVSTAFSLMHDLYRPAQVCTIFDHLSQRNISLSYRLWILLPGKKKIIFKNIERKRFKKNPSRIQERNHTLQKNESLHCGLVLRPFFRFFCLKWVVVDTFGDCGERKEKRRKETTKTKKTY